MSQTKTIILIHWLWLRIQNNITFILDLVHIEIFVERPTKITSHQREDTVSCMSCERTYRCLVDVVHVGGSSAACPDGVLAQRKEALSSSGQDTRLILEGFYSWSLVLSGPSPGGPASPLFVPQHVSMNVCLFMCVIWPIRHNHRAQIKMRQLLGSIL